MLTLYENEIKKRCDQRAQIKYKFTFPRMEEIKDYRKSIAMDVEPKSSDVTQKQIVCLKNEETKISARIDDRKSQQNKIKNM